VIEAEVVRPDRVAAGHPALAGVVAGVLRARDPERRGEPRVQVGMVTSNTALDEPSVCPQVVVTTASGTVLIQDLAAVARIDDDVTAVAANGD
jgi:hypothetical protein